MRARARRRPGPHVMVGVVKKPRHEARIDGSRAGGHDEPLERREAHGGVDRHAMEHGGKRCSGAQVARHDAQLVERAPNQFGGSAAGVRMTQAVEPIAADAVSLRATRRNGVRGGFGGHRGVECSIEAGERRNIGQKGAHRIDAA